MPAAPLPDLDALDASCIERQLIVLHSIEQLSSHAAEIERLRLLIARLQRLQFGRKSEKIERQIEQLQLQLEIWKRAAARKSSAAEKTLPPQQPQCSRSVTQKPVRRPLPDHLATANSRRTYQQEKLPGMWRRAE